MNNAKFYLQFLSFWAIVLMPVSRASESSQIWTPGEPRGYLVTPQELSTIRVRADQGIQPYDRAVSEILEEAGKSWPFKLESVETCSGADDPLWNDNGGGTSILYAKALAYHLTGNTNYARDVKAILERIMSEVKQISSEARQCQLNFAWGTPEMVASADLIEDYWQGMTCQGPLSTTYGDNQIGEGDCKELLQNWLVKNPFYIVSESQGMHNWGAAAAVTTSWIADYLWDRPEVKLVYRNPQYKNNGESFRFSPAEAFAHIKTRTLDDMNGYGVSFGSRDSCDLMSDSPDNDPRLGPPVKTQITESGIVAGDARRQEACNITRYNGEYQNYPQLALDNLIGYAEFMLRRGDSSIYDNIDYTDHPNYMFTDKNGKRWTTHLKPGRGSIERAINAVIVDAGTQWKRKGGLTIAYRYYFNHSRLSGTNLNRWADFIATSGSIDCSQATCFGELTHGFVPGEDFPEPAVVPYPGALQGSLKVHSFSPSQGEAGDKITLIGAGFESVDSVKFGLLEANFLIDSDSALIATAPLGCEPGKITVQAGARSYTTHDTFLVGSELEPPSALEADNSSSGIPVLTSFSPKHGSAGTRVRLYGHQLDRVRRVSFGNTAVDSSRVISNTEIETEVPPGAVTGPIQLTYDGGVTLCIEPFTISPSKILVFGPTDDARVSFAYADKNYASAEELRLRDSSSGGWKSYVKFDIDGVTGSPRRALLRLYVTDPSDSVGLVYKTLSNWNEDTITWRSAPMHSGYALATGEAAVEGTWAEFDVSSEVRGNGVFSFVLTPGSSNSVLFSTKEGPKPPELVIEVGQ